jgi:hypothetical protein
MVRLMCSGMSQSNGALCVPGSQWRQTGNTVTGMLERILLTASLLAACAGAHRLSQPGRSGSLRVLFIGNSLTAYNDLPGTLARLAAAVNDTIVVQSVTRPNLAVIDHLNGMTDAVDVIQREEWDYVILQQGPTSQQIYRDTLILAAKLLEPDVRAAGARIAQLMAWPAATNSGAFEGALLSCLETAAAVDGVCLGAGEAWRSAWAVDPTLQLYGPDGFHPSALGTYLAALVVYEGVTGHDARSLSQEAVVAGRRLNVPGATIALLQRVAHETAVKLAR